MIGLEEIIPVNFNFKNSNLINLKFLPININFVYEILLNSFFFPINYFLLHIFFKKLNLDKKL